MSNSPEQRETELKLECIKLALQTIGVGFLTSEMKEHHIECIPVLECAESYYEYINTKRDK